MSQLAKMSEANVANSLSLYLAGQLLAAGYLLYWHTIDSVQTNVGWYNEYSTKQATYLADSTFAAQVAAAKGLITLRGRTPANPTFITRLTNDGTVPIEDSEVPVPLWSVAISTPVIEQNLELGSGLRWRLRGLSIRGFARDEREQSIFVDLLSEWLDQDKIVTVNDHDAGTLAQVGTIQVLNPASNTSTSLDAEATTFAFQFNARLEYVA
jgi:hypothetical protein